MPDRCSRRPPRPSTSTSPPGPRPPCPWPPSGWPSAPGPRRLRHRHHRVRHHGVLPDVAARPRRVGPGAPATWCRRMRSASSSVRRCSRSSAPGCRGGRCCWCSWRLRARQRAVARSPRPSARWCCSRFLAGLPHGAYFGIAAIVAASLVPPERRARAVARVMLGLTVANLVGVPLGHLARAAATAGAAPTGRSPSIGALAVGRGAVRARTSRPCPGRARVASSARCAARRSG